MKYKDSRSPSCFVVDFSRARDRSLSFLDLALAFCRRPTGPLDAVMICWLQEAGLTELIETFETRDSDVFVCTYVKSGTTYTQQILTLVRETITKTSRGDSSKYVCSRALKSAYHVR